MKRYLFSFQRFEHIKGASKIDAFIEFPIILNMLPFLSYKYQDIKSTSLSTLENDYYLFSVVNHKGSIDSGHYICYIRQHHEVIISKSKRNDHLLTQTYSKKVVQN
jgi:ubiquitin carboxyl-terminal hydrolase 22/27/51